MELRAFERFTPPAQIYYLLTLVLGTKALDEETRPGGQLDTLRWRVTSIMNHQFLTATMILCSLLHRGQTLDERDAIMAALRGARAIWIRTSTTSREAQRATEGVSFVLAKAGEAHELPIHPQRKPPPTATPRSDDFGIDFSVQDTFPDVDVEFSTCKCICDPKIKDAAKGKCSHGEYDAAVLGCAYDQSTARGHGRQHGYDSYKIRRPGSS